MESTKNTSLSLLRELTEKLVSRDLALIESEKKFKGFFDNSSAGMCIFDINTEKFIEVNKALCNWLGYTREELLKHPVGYFLAEQDNKTSEFLEEQRQLLEDSGEALEVHNFINEYRHKNGSSVWLRWNATAPNEYGINYNVCNNITRELELKKEARQNRLIYQSIIQNSNELIKLYQIVDGVPVLIYVSESIVDYTGYAPQEHISQGLSELIHPDDAEQTMKEMLSILTVKKKTSVKYRGKHKDKGYVWAESVLTPILDSKENVEYILLSSRIIQEFKDREDKLMKEVELLHKGEKFKKIGTYEVKLTGDEEYVHVSEAFLELFDIPSNTPAHKMRECIENRMTKHTAKGAAASWKEAIITEGKEFDFIYWITKLNGIKRLFRGRGTVVRDDNGTPLTMVGTVQDITEQKESFTNLIYKETE